MSQSQREVSPARQNAVLAVMCLAVVVVIANVSSLNVAVPAIGRSLGAEQSQLQWVVDAFALLLAAFLLPAGAIGDRFSRKGTLVSGFFLMTLASVWSAKAGGATELIVARGAAGIGAAFVFPSTLSTLTAIMPDHKRGRAVAMWTACAATGGIVGIIGAGAVLQNADWRWIFWGNAGLCGVFLLLAAVVAVDTKDPAHAHLDPLGTVASVVGIGGVVLAITEGPVRGWTSPLTLMGAAAGALGIVLFMVWELRARRPLLDVRLFKQPLFGTAALSIFLLFLATFGAFFLCVQYVAYTFGYGPLDSGLALLPIGVTLMPSSFFGVALARRLGTYGVEALGMLVCGVGLLLLARLGEHDTFWSFAPPLMAFGLGVGLCQGPATEAIVAALPAAKQGVASAVNDSARELGGALGIAVIGSLFNVGYRSAVKSAVGLPAELFDQVRNSPATGLQAARGSPEVIAVVRHSFVHGWRLSLAVAAGIVIAGGLYIGTVGHVLRRRRKAEPPAVLHVPDHSEIVADAEAELAASVDVEPGDTFAGGVVPPEAVTLDGATVEALPTTAVATSPAPISVAHERDQVAVTTDVVRQAESSLAALRLLVGEQQRTLARLDEETRRVTQVRRDAADVLERAASELARLADGLREEPEP